MKRYLIIFLSLLVMAGSILSISVIGNSTSDVTKTEAAVSIDSLNIGDYFTLGKYNDAPIIWRYVADDENGKLIVSDKILCFKPFDEENFWEESYIRNWLNSTVSEGEMDWGLGAFFDGWINKNLNPKEKGFLNKENFSQSEKRVINTVTQWTMLPEKHVDLSINGITETYNQFKEYKPGRPEAGGYFIFHNISELSSVYIGAAYEMSDYIFLLDEMQIYEMWKNFDNVKAARAEKCESNLYHSSGEYFSYMLRTPQTSTSCSEISSEGEYQGGNSFFADGIRPAFYLNTDNALILSGSGTADHPYVMNGKEIEVYANCARLNLNDLPTIKDGIVMVPMKETFENLGVKVNWDEEAKSVTIERDGNYIFMMSDNKGIMINGEISDMGYPMTMIDDIEYVPLTALEKSITPNITWDGESQRIDILTK